MSATVLTATHYGHLTLLAFAHSAGAAYSRQALAYCSFGLVGATCAQIFLVPTNVAGSRECKEARAGIPRSTDRTHRHQLKRSGDRKPQQGSFVGVGFTALTVEGGLGADRAAGKSDLD